MRQLLFSISVIVLFAGCVNREPVIREDMLTFDGPMPSDFGGSWERDYTRGDDAHDALRAAIYELQRRSVDSGPNGERYIPRQQQEAVYAIAQLADEITRIQVLTIAQNENEISIAREDDYAIYCAFFDGQSKRLASNYGIETCGWDGGDLVSHAQLPNGLQVIHRFTISPDAQQLRVITTVASRKAPMPFTLDRFYRKFEAPASDFNCVETLSMKRVCSTGDLEL